jgi:hypothetical protein
MTEPTQRPVPAKQLDEHFEARDALTLTPITLERRFHIIAEREPRVETRLERVDRGDGQPHWEVIVDVDGVRAGGRGLPTALNGQATKIRKRKIREEELAEQLTAFIPDHLGFNATPRELIKGLRTIRPAASSRRVATTIFGTDNRLVFQTPLIRGRQQASWRLIAVRARV